MLVECPHCLVRVLPNEDFTCPSCRHDVRAPLTSPDKQLTVTEATRFPSFCCTCGEDTPDSESLDALTHSAEPLLIRLLVGAALLVKPLQLLKHRHVLQGESVVFRVTVPRCRKCQKTAALLPLNVNLARRTMVLRVRRSFAEAVERLG